MKKCTRCFLMKDLSEFSKSVLAKDGYVCACKVCTRKRSLELRIIKSGKEPRTTKTKQENRDRNNAYRKNKFKLDPVFKLKCNTRSLLHNAFNRACKSKYIKSEATENMLCCSMDFFISYIESKFLEGMNISNYGKWHLDHIKPISNCNSYEDIVKYNHYTNFQPLWAKDNIKKSNKQGYNLYSL